MADYRLRAVTIEKAPLQTRLVARHKDGFPLIVEIRGGERAIYVCGSGGWLRREDLAGLWLLEEEGGTMATTEGVKANLEAAAAQRDVVKDVYADVKDAVERLRGPAGRGGSRCVSLAITHLQEAEAWLARELGGL